MNKINKEFVPYDIALAMKELGFDEKCLGMYYNAEDGVKYVEPTWKFLLGKKGNPNNESEVNAPLYQQAFRWFREEYDLYGSVGYEDDLKSKWGGSVKGYYETWGKYDLGFTGWFKTYEEAQDACLRKLIEIVKEKNL